MLPLCWYRTKLVVLCQLVSTSVPVQRQITAGLIVPTCVHLCPCAETSQLVLLYQLVSTYVLVLRQITAGLIMPTCVHLCPCAETDHSWSYYANLCPLLSLGRDRSQLSYCANLCPPLSLCWNRSKLVLLCQLVSTSVPVLRQIEAGLIVPTCVHFCPWTETDHSCLIVPACVHLCPCAETDHSWFYYAKLCPPLSLCWDRSKLVLLCQLLSTSVPVLRQIKAELVYNPTASVMHLLCLVVVCLTTESVLWDYITSNGGMVNEYRIAKIRTESFVL